MDETVLSRIEDAGLNASAPPQQRWMDGWLVRLSPGKAKRARCINAVAAGRMSLAKKLALCEAEFRSAGLPVLVRITPFTQPAGLDAQLAELGYSLLDDTRVMFCELSTMATEKLELPAGTHWVALSSAVFADAVGALRGSSAQQREAHAHRLALSPVPYHGYALRRYDDGAVLACGQFAIECELVGLYDVFTLESQRGKGLARVLCERMLSLSTNLGAKVAYLQVEHDNHFALRTYQRLGFTEAYRYHYRQAPA